eukprot:CAMPEP_0172679164 /NCGR_PEP_ID=MMETSP1074-20121228/15885_1 /TAXON_ID=2916 /ORGANISM="Ceratium fusus, Strain PA161109" /LENGTH=56 /DNA_ID=CAMNT_0013497297 /DNA_START=67 /DNA_END=234 /DNA_ORIENTATION=+
MTLLSVRGGAASRAACTAVVATADPIGAMCPTETNVTEVAKSTANAKGKRTLCERD